MNPLETLGFCAFIYVIFILVACALLVAYGAWGNHQDIKRYRAAAKQATTPTKETWEDVCCECNDIECGDFSISDIEVLAPESVRYWPLPSLDGKQQYACEVTYQPVPRLRMELNDADFN
jgi:hypothetical protein